MRPPLHLGGDPDFYALVAIVAGAAIGVAALARIVAEFWP